MQALLKLHGLMYLRNIFLIILIDGLVFDDEPVWEPIEWGMVQTWLLFLFMFTWVAEVLFSSRFGSYTNRDKKVWLGLHKAYWLFQLWFILNMFIVTIFVTLPFYFEITYSISYIVLWWNWFNSIFFFKITTIFSLILIILGGIKFQLRWMSASRLLVLFIIILLLIAYLLYFNFIHTFFAFFSSDVNAFSKNGWLDFNRATHGPLKWGYGSASRDHFSFHKITTTFWYKNDPLIAASMLFLNLFLFFYLFFLFFQTLVMVRLLYKNNTVSYNNLTMFYASVKQFYYMLLFFLFLILLCFVYQLVRFPFEYLWFNRFFFFVFTFIEIIFDFVHLFF